MSFVPNTTPTPNWLYNGEMEKMNETQLKVVLLVTRKTLGWFDPTTTERKIQDYISQSQFMEFTGKSHTAIALAIQSAVENGWIIARDRQGNLCDTSEKRRRRKVWYQLGSVFTSKISKQQSGLDENLSNIVAKSKQHNSSNLSNKVDNTKETITKETIQNYGGDNFQYQPINDEGEPVAKRTGLKTPTTIKENFDFKEELKRLSASPAKVHKIAAHYFTYRGLKFANQDQYEPELARTIKAAKELKGYSGDQIDKTFRYCQKEWEDSWTLETVARWISQVNK